MSRYEHTDAKSTVIGATVKKIHLPIYLLRKETIGFIYINYIKHVVSVSSKHQLVNLYLLRVWPGWCAKGHKVYTGLGQNVPTSSLRLLLMLLALKGS